MLQGTASQVSWLIATLLFWLLSRLLGHSSIKMTEKYAHNKISKLRVDIAKLSLKGKQAEVVSIHRKEVV